MLEWKYKMLEWKYITDQGNLLATSPPSLMGINIHVVLVNIICCALYPL